jgi:hypothetical protein
MDSESVVTGSTATMHTCLESLWDHESRLSQHGTVGVGGTSIVSNVVPGALPMLGPADFMKNIRVPIRTILPSNVQTVITLVSRNFKEMAQEILNWCGEQFGTSELFDSFIEALILGSKRIEATGFVVAIWVVGISLKVVRTARKDRLQCCKLP